MRRRRFQGTEQEGWNVQAALAQTNPVRLFSSLIGQLLTYINRAEAETVEEAEAMVKDDNPAQEAGPSSVH